MIKLYWSIAKDIFWCSVIPFLILHFLCDHPVKHAIGYSILVSIFYLIAEVSKTPTRATPEPKEREPYYKVKD